MLRLGNPVACSAPEAIARDAAIGERAACSRGDQTA